MMTYRILESLYKQSVVFLRIGLVSCFAFVRLAHAGAYSDIVINQYAILQMDAKQGDSMLSIRPSGDPGVPAISSLRPGDLLLIIQMQGAQVTLPASKEDPSYGTVHQLGGAGLHELVRVQSYATDANGGGTVILEKSCGGLKNSYRRAGHTQVIFVPQSEQVTVQANETFTSPAWNGDVGGVVALKTKTLILNHDINVAGKGFRGGEVSLANQGRGVNVSTTVYYSDTSADGGQKGESIAGGSPECTQRGDCYGRGAVANGGGGGNNYGAGGGGGSNGSTGTAWTGAGHMNQDPMYAGAWQKDPAYLGKLSDSSGGGRGGYSFSLPNSPLNPSLYGPGHSLWKGNFRQEIGGLGGRPLPYNNTSERIFLGGGGGAGHAAKSSGSSGGNGGGIIFIIANQIVGNGTLIANGAPGGTGISSDGVSTDGQGGGGGGGTIVTYANTISGPQFFAIGGRGGDQNVPTLNADPNQANGGGGGGTGGKIFLSNGSSPSMDVGGGLAGETNGVTMSSFPMNGATDGAQGSVEKREELSSDQAPICVGIGGQQGGTTGHLNLQGTSIQKTFELSGGGMSPTGCSVASPESIASTGTLLEVAVLAALTIASRIAQRLRKQTVR